MRHVDGQVGNQKGCTGQYGQGAQVEHVYDKQCTSRQESGLHLGDH
jgi:hypothetical protein